MAKQVGSALRGSFDGLSFYHDRLHGYLVRCTGGVTSKKYHTDPRYAAARAASLEFTGVSRAGKLIRAALGEFVVQVKDGTMANRLNRELVALKQLDREHFRGERRPETAMPDAALNQTFRIFQFNAGVQTCALVTDFPQVLRSGGFRIDDIRLAAAAFPDGATHAGLTLVRTVIDFELGTFATCASAMALVSPDDSGTSLLIRDLPAMTGIELVCLQVVFFREENGALRQLQGQVHGMGILAVERVEKPEMRSPLRGLRARRVLPNIKPVLTVLPGIKSAESSPRCFLHSGFTDVGLRAP